MALVQEKGGTVTNWEADKRIRTESVGMQENVWTSGNEALGNRVSGNGFRSQDELSTEGKTRIVQELVPGKQITIAHLIANPDKILYEKLGLDPSVDYSRSAIGVLTISPAETAVIAADIAIKAAGIELGFVDRFSGTLIITGTVSETEASLKAVLDYTKEKMGFAVCPLTRT